MNEKPKIYVYPGHPLIQTYKKENPPETRTWEKDLFFLIENFPQIRDGEIEYVIEGGVAVYLLNPQRQNPDDVDIVYRSSQTGTDFSGLPAKWIDHWLLLRRLPASPKNTNLFFDNCTNTNYKGRNVFIPNRVLLALSKQIDFHDRPPRDKDIKDIGFLNASPEEIQNLLELFKQG